MPPRLVFRWWLLSSFAFLCLAGCGSKGSGALGVTVKLTENSRARCVVVVVKPKNGGKTQSTDPRARGGKSELHIGVRSNAELTGDVTVEALAFVDPGCAAASFNESSGAASA